MLVLYLFRADIEHVKSEAYPGPEKWEKGLRAGHLENFFMDHAFETFANSRKCPFRKAFL